MAHMPASRHLRMTRSNPDVFHAVKVATSIARPAMTSLPGEFWNPCNRTFVSRT